jgi:hypothetical protein
MLETICVTVALTFRRLNENRENEAPLAGRAILKGFASPDARELQQRRSLKLDSPAFTRYGDRDRLDVNIALRHIVEIDDYANIEVYLDDGSTATVSVHHYKCRNPSFGGTVAAEAFKDRLVQTSKAHVLKEMSAVAVLEDISVPSEDSMMAWVAESSGEMMYRPLTIRTTPVAGKFTVMGHGGTAVIFSIGLTA